MKISSVNLISFSPCGHTLTYGRLMADVCAANAELEKFEEIDITPHGSAHVPRSFSSDSVAILCAPVFGGRIPAPAVARFRKFAGQNTPAVLLVTYGNRDYDDALLELAELARELGFWPVGAASCVAQHTLVDGCGSDRPDQSDLASAKTFATEISAMLASDAIPQNSTLSVPGKSPYREYKAMALPQRVNDNCIMCGQCWTACPTGAIATGAPGNIDADQCIACMSCIEICPVGARIPAEPFLRKVAEKLLPLCAKPRRNEYFTI